VRATDLQRQRGHHLPHQSGMVKPLPRQTKVMVGGAFALRITDMAGSPAGRW